MAERVANHSWARSAYLFLKTTLVGGLVFMVPIFVLAFLGTKAVKLLQRLGKPLAAVLPVDSTLWGLVVADVIAIVAVIIACFLGGLLARVSFAGRFVRKAEMGVLWRIPGYGFVKALTDSLDKRAAESTLRPVLIHFDDAAQLAFEVDRLPDGRRVIYIPSSPDPRAGSVMVMDADRVEPVPMTFLATLRSMRALGRGLGPLLNARPWPEKGPTT
jgi:uncharacterized membrane protein